MRGWLSGRFRSFSGRFRVVSASFSGRFRIVPKSFPSRSSKLGGGRFVKVESFRDVRSIVFTLNVFLMGVTPVFPECGDKLLKRIWSLKRKRQSAGPARKVVFGRPSQPAGRELVRCRIQKSQCYWVGNQVWFLGGNSSDPILSVSRFVVPASLNEKLHEKECPLSGFMFWPCEAAFREAGLRGDTHPKGKPAKFGM